MTEATALEGGAIAPDSGLALRRNVALVMLFVVGTINFVDRQLLSVLVEPIRAEMDFSDTQFGLLTGFAFALFYAAAGVPVAMIADRWNRVKLIGIACVVWSGRSEEHTSELQSLMRISYAVFCLKKKKHTLHTHTRNHNNH